VFSSVSSDVFLAEYDAGLQKGEMLADSVYSVKRATAKLSLSHKNRLFNNTLKLKTSKEFDGSIGKIEDTKFFLDNRLGTKLYDNIYFDSKLNIGFDYDGRMKDSFALGNELTWKLNYMSVKALSGSLLSNMKRVEEDYFLSKSTIRTKVSFDTWFVYSDFVLEKKSEDDSQEFTRNVTRLAKRFEKVVLSSAIINRKVVRDDYWVSEFELLNLKFSL
jgi:hypothetical protein